MANRSLTIVERVAVSAFIHAATTAIDLSSAEADDEDNFSKAKVAEAIKKELKKEPATIKFLKELVNRI